ncbi:MULTISPECIES: DNA alkylation repair protein [Microbispora]|uniref:DNA alkylation repair protein n=2 Tax=Microbispora TaxID=2005 RepID=A0A5J5JVJ5_9ACTN|nr:MULTISPECIES: DNA alkylation repair protein [Microbispora]KAA9375632.1 DNA alkylation repair protein [Microbispora cellulosiformans]GIH34261.1 DNA alkylation repair protein [Microbispora amethystogenes]
MTLHKAVRLALTEAADPARAQSMRAYMKSEMPFLGVTAVPRRALLRRLFTEHRLDSAPEWRRAVLALWRDAEYREERYAAIELSAHRFYRSWQTLYTIPMYEEMIVTGAWWDFVDDIAIHRIGTLLRLYPESMRRLVLEWAHDADLWKRRAAILCQNSFKDGTDVHLLYACIEPSLSDTDFFARKAIGWALREYARTNPEEVLRYVKHRGLSGLSRREALRNLPGA